jgi:hypothetical protein
MDIEFHYHMTYQIALRAGFRKTDAFTIAYSSQYTDDNNYSYEIVDNTSKRIYINYLSQTENITKPQADRLNIYPLFHFCPGTKKEVFDRSPIRRDGHFSLLTTIPDNSNARRIFEDAFKFGSLYRIGIGTHMYADSFCHRDFSGWKDNFNYTKLDGFLGTIWSAIGPEIGHALAMHNPDIPSLVWIDERLALTSPDREKKNKEQILSAAGRIFDYYCVYTGKSKTSKIKTKLIGDLSEAIGEEAEDVSKATSEKDNRITRYEALIGNDFIEFDPDDWFDKAVREEKSDPSGASGQSKTTYSWKPDYANSDWFKFQEAVKQHHDFAFSILRETFDLMGITTTLLKCVPVADGG